MLKSALIVAIGGGIGSVARFALSQLVVKYSQGTFPWATLWVNLLGCLVIGLLYGFIEKGTLISYEWRLFLAVGICGGFTTFSTFSNEGLILIKSGEFLSFAIYTSVSVLIGIFLVFVGYSIPNLIR